MTHKIAEFMKQIEQGHHESSMNNKLGKLFDYIGEHNEVRQQLGVHYSTNRKTINIFGNDISVNTKVCLPLAKGEVKVSTSILSPIFIVTPLHPPT